MLDPDLYQTVVDSMSAHVAILDADGVIIETNRAWQDFAVQNGMKGCVDSVGINYLRVCDGAAGSHGDDANNVADGIRKVLAGELP